MISLWQCGYGTLGDLWGKSINQCLFETAYSAEIENFLLKMFKNVKKKKTK